MIVLNVQCWKYKGKRVHSNTFIKRVFIINNSNNSTMKNKGQERILSLTPISVACCYLSIISMMRQCEGFTASTTTTKSPVTFVTKQLNVNNYINSRSYKNMKVKSSTQIYLQAPPGSGYLTEEDEESKYPDTYEPMMEYPGTMRPGRTPENQPYSSLPIQESDPDPVPWPHFQEIEWHHNWGSPHEHPIPMEEFIDMHGRWATAEMEAEMRAGARRGVRERRELEEAQKAASFILDDDEDDEDGENSGPQLDLGEGVDALIGAGAAAAATISKSATKVDDNIAQLGEDDDDDDNFLLDLGLDETGDEEDDEEDEDNSDDDGEEPAFATGDDGTEGILEAMQSMIDAEDDTDVAADEDSNEIDIDFDDLGLNFDDEGDDDDDISEEEEEEDDDDFVVMDDDDISMENEDLTLDEMVGNEDMGADDEFDDGGFDYD